jgi:hypothetical protein
MCASSVYEPQKLQILGHRPPRPTDGWREMGLVTVCAGRAGAAAILLIAAVRRTTNFKHETIPGRGWGQISAPANDGLECKCRGPGAGAVERRTNWRRPSCDRPARASCRECVPGQQRAAPSERQLVALQPARARAHAPVAAPLFARANIIEFSYQSQRPAGGPLRNPAGGRRM